MKASRMGFMGAAAAMAVTSAMQSDGTEFRKQLRQDRDEYLERARSRGRYRNHGAKYACRFDPDRRKIKLSRRLNVKRMQRGK